MIHGKCFDEDAISDYATEAFFDIKKYSSPKFDDFIGRLMAMKEGDEFSLTKTEILEELRKLCGTKTGAVDDFKFKD